MAERKRKYLSNLSSKLVNKEKIWKFERFKYVFNLNGIFRTIRLRFMMRFIEVEQKIWEKIKQKEDMNSL